MGFYYLLGIFALLATTAVIGIIILIGIFAIGAIIVNLFDRKKKEGEEDV